VVESPARSLIGTPCPPPTSSECTRPSSKQAKRTRDPLSLCSAAYINDPYLSLPLPQNFSPTSTANLRTSESSFPLPSFDNTSSSSSIIIILQYKTRSRFSHRFLLLCNSSHFAPHHADWIQSTWSCVGPTLQFSLLTSLASHLSPSSYLSQTSYISFTPTPVPPQSQSAHSRSRLQKFRLTPFRLHQLHLPTPAKRTSRQVSQMKRAKKSSPARQELFVEQPGMLLHLPPNDNSDMH